MFVSLRKAPPLVDTSIVPGDAVSYYALYWLAKFVKAYESKKK
ncbi:hypothetical protein [Peribacillus loiseleuriae]|nr:hypothetical protein [Peribacillus loiseleuriae]